MKNYDNNQNDSYLIERILKITEHLDDSILSEINPAELDEVLPNFFKEVLPIFRVIGKISGNKRDLIKEFKELQEPDPDIPELWNIIRKSLEKNYKDFIKGEENEKIAVSEEDIGKILDIIDKVVEEYPSIELPDGNLNSDPKQVLNPEDFKQLIALLKDFFTKIGTQLNNRDIEFYIGGQSHIDIAWKWRYLQTLKKVIVTYKKAVYHTKVHPDYTFVSSQPILLEWILKEDPQLFEEIKDAAKTGRFDLCGGMYCEPDCHIPSGESFVRQRFYGQRFYLKHLKTLSLVEWVPDSFGFANTLPQIYLKSGSPYFMTTKLTSNKETKFPFINFKWRSPDGSELVTMMNPGSYEAFRLFKSSIPRRRLVKEGKEIIADYSIDKPEESEYLVDKVPPVVAFAGKGDGGHGPTGSEVTLFDMLNKIYKTPWITATDYFTNILNPVRDRLPVWNDELYYEFHRGTLSTQGLVKYMNRYFENKLVAVEKFATLVDMVERLISTSMSLERENYTEAERSETHEQNIDEINNIISYIWKHTLLNQFHDVLPGSSIPEVYDDVYDLWSVDKELLSSLEDKFWNQFVNRFFNDGKNPDILVFNSTCFDFENIPIEIELKNGEELKRSADKSNSFETLISELKKATPTLTLRADNLDTKEYDKLLRTYVKQNIQFIEGDTEPLDTNFLKRPPRILFETPLKQHSFRIFSFDKSEDRLSLNLEDSIDNNNNPGNQTSKESIKKTNNENINLLKCDEGPADYILENKYYRININKKSGDITSIYDKELSKEILRAPGVLLKTFFDWLPDEQCWNLMPQYRLNELDPPTLENIYISEEGPVRAAISIEKKFFNEDSESVPNGESRIYQKIAIYRNSRGILMEFKADWHSCETDLKLDLNYSEDLNPDYSISETPYGTIKRKINPSANHDKPRWENVHHSWVDIPAEDESWGIMVINDGKYGYDTLDNKLGLTLLRGPRYPTVAQEAWVGMERKNNGREPVSHADMGWHRFKYLILPHSGRWFDNNENLGIARAFNHGILSRWNLKLELFQKLSNKSSESNDERSSLNSASNGSEINENNAIDSMIDNFLVSILNSNLNSLIRVSDKRAEITVIKPIENDNPQIIEDLYKDLKHKSNYNVSFIVRVVEISGDNISMEDPVTIKFDPFLRVKNIDELDLLEIPLHLGEQSGREVDNPVLKSRKYWIDDNSNTNTNSNTNSDTNSIKNSNKKIGKGKESVDFEAYSPNGYIEKLELSFKPHQIRTFRVNI